MNKKMICNYKDCTEEAIWNLDSTFHNDKYLHKFGYQLCRKHNNWVHNNLKQYLG